MDEQTLIAALEQALRQRGEGEGEGDAMTTDEIAAAMRDGGTVISKNTLYDVLRSMKAEGRIEVAWVGRLNLADRIQRVPAYRLKHE